MNRPEAGRPPRPRAARAWAPKVELLLLACLALLWVGAKVHFFTRFGKTSIHGYLLEHWPFWALMGLVALLLLLVEWMEGA